MTWGRDPGTAWADPQNITRGWRQVEGWEVVGSLTTRAGTNSISEKFPFAFREGMKQRRQKVWRKKKWQKVTSQSCEDCDLLGCDTFWSKSGMLSGKSLRKTDLERRFSDTENGEETSCSAESRKPLTANVFQSRFNETSSLNSTLKAVALHRRPPPQRIRARRRKTPQFRS